MPLVNVAMGSTAWPIVLIGALPRDLEPSLKVTVPVGVPPALELTFAVKLTVCPKFDGLGEELKLVVVGLIWTTCVTVPELAVKFVVAA